MTRRSNPLDLTDRLSRPWIAALIMIGILAVWILVSGCGQDASPDEFAYATIRDLPEPSLGVTGRLEVWPSMPSDFVEPREIQIWLPPEYDGDPAGRYPVIYVHDGQNLFDPSRSPFSGRDWALDEVMTALMDTGAVRPAIIVGIESQGMRILEMAPEDVMTDIFPPDTLAEARRQLERGVNIPASQPLLGNAYLSFVTDELMPRIETRYRVLTGPENTFVMGSSMGGLASIYALYKRPDVFGGAAALSTHWPVVGDYMLDWFAEQPPLPASHRLYMDRGTETLDSQYGPYQRDVDRALGVAGASHMTSHVFKGHAHTEADWRRRVHLPLQFLLGTHLGRAAPGTVQ